MHFRSLALLDCSLLVTQLGLLVVEPSLLGCSVELGSHPSRALLALWF